MENMNTDIGRKRLRELSQNSPFNNCVLGHQVFEQERGKWDFVTIQMLLFLKSKLLCYHGN